MSRKFYEEFKRFWLDNYINQYRKNNTKERVEIKKNIYKQINLNEQEKDLLWDMIVKRGSDI